MTVLFKIQMNEKYVGWKGEEMVGSNSPLGWKNGDAVGRSGKFFCEFRCLFRFTFFHRSRGKTNGVGGNYEQVSDVERDSQTDSDVSSARRVILDEIRRPHPP